jgi:predicted DNA-binding transcriptional regulator YafY
MPEKFCEFINVLYELNNSPEGLTFAEINRITGNKSEKSAKRIIQAVEDVFRTKVEELRDEDNHRIKRFRLPRLDLRLLARFSSEELVELNTAIQFCRNSHHPAAVDTLERIRDKIKSVMDSRETVESDLEFLSASELAVPMPGPQCRIDPTIFQTLRQAILAETVIEVEYQKVFTHPVHTYRLHPYGLIYGKRNYLVAHNPDAAQIRMHALTHFRSAQLTDESFSRPDDFRLSDFMANAFGVFVSQPQDIVLRFSPEARNDVVQFHFHDSQQLTELPDGQVELRLHCCGLRELCHHLFTWGPHVKIIEPDELRKMYLDMLRNTLSPYTGACDNGLVN